MIVEDTWEYICESKHDALHEDSLSVNSVVGENTFDVQEDRDGEDGSAQPLKDGKVEKYALKHQ